MGIFTDPTQYGGRFAVANRPLRLNTIRQTLLTCAVLRILIPGFLWFSRNCFLSVLESLDASEIFPFALSRIFWKYLLSNSFFASRKGHIKKSGFTKAEDTV